jgi:hypothetical protein
MTRGVESGAQTCDPSKNSEEGSRNGAGYNVECDSPYYWCLQGRTTAKCVSYDEYVAGYDPDLEAARAVATRGDGAFDFSGAPTDAYTMSDLSDAGAASEIDLSQLGEDSDAELTYTSDDITAIFTRNNPDYRTGGYYDSPVFLATENLNVASFLEDGDMGIYYDKFYYYTKTYTLYYSAETVDSPEIVEPTITPVTSYIDIDNWSIDKMLEELGDTFSPEEVGPRFGTGVFGPRIIQKVLNIVESINLDWQEGRISEDEARVFFVSWHNWQIISDAIAQMPSRAASYGRFGP